MNILRIHTDGACAGNQNETNLGGWGAVLEYGARTKELYGAERNTTNNRMEMTALLKALEAIKKDGQMIQCFSDSAYLMDCFRKKWYVNWQRNGWKTAKKQPVENRDLWEQLIPFLDRHTFEFYRVKGHLNLDWPGTNVDKHYRQFVDWNGEDFSLADFRHVVAMNNRCDELANVGVDELRKEDTEVMAED